MMIFVFCFWFGLFEVGRSVVLGMDISSMGAVCQRAVVIRDERRKEVEEGVREKKKWVFKNTRQTL